MLATAVSSRPSRSSSALPPPAAKSRGYAPYLEGLRGLAALYVVLHHAALQSYPGEYDSTQLSVFARVCLTVCDRGDVAVAIFIVLSGYCLMLPVAATGRLRDGALGFFRRRAQRILPAYYACLTLLLGVLWLVPALQTPDGTHRDLALPALDGGVIASHLLLVHNFSANWIWKLNGPLWSVAVEWQMYGLFPLLVVVFLRHGARVGRGVGLGLGYALTGLLLACDRPLAAHTCPWYLGLFAMGMAAAQQVQSSYAAQTPRGGWLLRAGGWLVLALGLERLLTAAPQLRAWGVVPSMIVDPLLAQALVCVLFHCSVVRPHGTHSQLQAWLERPALLLLGSFSYSLYLVHDPLISFMARAMLSAGVTDELRTWLCLCAAVPLSVLGAYGFYVCAERPFLPKRAKIADSPRVAPQASLTLTRPEMGVMSGLISTQSCRARAACTMGPEMYANKLLVPMLKNASKPRASSYSSCASLASGSASSNNTTSGRSTAPHTGQLGGSVSPA